MLPPFLLTKDTLLEAISKGILIVRCNDLCYVHLVSLSITPLQQTVCVKTVSFEYAHSLAIFSKQLYFDQNRRSIDYRMTHVTDQPILRACERESAANVNLTVHCPFSG